MRADHLWACPSPTPPPMAGAHPTMPLGSVCDPLPLCARTATVTGTDGPSGVPCAGRAVRMRDEQVPAPTVRAGLWGSPLDSHGDGTGLRS